MALREGSTHAHSLLLFLAGKQAERRNMSLYDQMFNEYHDPKEYRKSAN